MESLTPEEYALLLQLGNDNLSLDEQLAMQQAQAKYARKAGSTPQGQMAGNVYVKPHWMEYVGALAQQKTAADFDKQGRESQATKNKNTLEQNMLIAKALQGQRDPQVDMTRDYSMGQ